MTNLEPLWRIEEELEVLVNSIDTCPEELRAELEARIAEYVGAEVAKVDRIGAVLSSLGNIAANAKAEIDRLRQRQQSAERAAVRLESYVLGVMRERGGGPLKGRNVTFTVCRSEALIIDNADAVPAEWKRTTVKIDIPKDALKQAIKAGDTVPGVHIEVRENLQRK